MKKSKSFEIVKDNDTDFLTDEYHIYHIIDKITEKDFYIVYKQEEGSSIKRFIENNPHEDNISYINIEFVDDFITELSNILWLLANCTMISIRFKSKKQILSLMMAYEL